MIVAETINNLRKWLFCISLLFLIYLQAVGIIYDFRKLVIFCILAFGLLLLAKPKLGLYILLFSSCFQPEYLLASCFYYKGIAMVSWIPYFILLYLLVMEFCKKIIYRESFQFGLIKNILLILLFFSIVGLISAILNGTSLITSIFSFRSFLLIFGSIILLYLNRFEKHELSTLLKFILILGLLQLPVVLLQRFVFFKGGDAVTGTFEAYPPLVFFILFCIACVVISKFKETKVLPFPFWLLISFYVLTLGLSNAKVTWLYLPILIGFLNRTVLFIKKRRRNILISILVLPLVFAGYLLFKQVYKLGYGFKLDNSIYTIEGISRYHFGGAKFGSKFTGTKGGVLKRGASITYAFDLISDDWRTLFFGYGPGSFSDCSISGGSGRFKMEGYKLYQITISVLLAEYGILGIIGFCILIWRLYFYGSPFVKNGDHDYELIAEIMKGLVLIILLMSIYFNVLREPIVWLLVAIIIKMTNLTDNLPDNVSQFYADSEIVVPKRG